MRKRNRKERKKKKESINYYAMTNPTSAAIATAIPNSATAPTAAAPTVSWEGRFCVLVGELELDVGEDSTGDDDSTGDEDGTKLCASILLLRTDDDIIGYSLDK